MERQQQRLQQQAGSPPDEGEAKHETIAMDGPWWFNSLTIRVRIPFNCIVSSVIFSLKIEDGGWP